MALRRGFLALALVIRGVRAAQGIELSNGIIVAQFDERGLTSISNGNRQYGFSSDAFWVVIDGQTIEPNRLPKPSVARTGGAITYKYTANGLTIDVIYELRPAWAFVS